MAKQRITLNVGGKNFQTYRNTLRRHPNTLLANLSTDSIFWDCDTEEYFFDRDPNMFPVILNFYRFGEVHLPHNVCGPSMRRELEFWGIQDQKIAACCWKSYNSYQDQERCIKMIEEAFGGTQLYELNAKSSRKTRLKARIHTFLEEPMSSTAAKVFSWIFGILLVLTVAITVMSSHKSFRVDTSLADNEKYANETNPKKRLHTTTRPHISLLTLDYGLLCFFTLELGLRFAVCPNKVRFLKSFFNVVDVVAVLPKWVALSINYAHPRYFTNNALFNLMGYLSICEVFRVLRILKLAKNFTGLKVLILTVRASLQEMALLLFIVIIGSMMFAVGIYYSEFDIEDEFPDMAIGSYWALITMTSVGYGDMYPQTHWGRLVAITCALFGIFCTGLPIPIIANNFDLYYSYARIRKAMKDRENEHKIFLKEKIQKNAFRMLSVAKALAQPMMGDAESRRKRDESEPPIDINKLPIFLQQTPKKDLHIIRRAFYRYHYKLKAKKKLKTRDSSESTNSMALTIPSTDVTDVSSNGSESVLSNHCCAHNHHDRATPGGDKLRVVSGKSRTRFGRPLTRKVSPQQGTLTSREVILKNMHDLDLM